MTKWVDKQREKGVEPCFIQMKNSPDQKRPKMMKFVTLINSENTKTIKNLGLFFFYAFKMKNEQAVTLRV